MRDLNLALCHCHKTRREEVHIRVDGAKMQMYIRRNIVNFYCQWALYLVISIVRDCKAQ